MSRASNGRGSVYRSKDTTGWEGLVSFGHDPVTGKRLRKKVRGRTKNEVQAKVDQLALLRRNVRGPVDFRLTFSEFMHRWVDAKVDSVAASTISGYRTDLLYVDQSGVGAVRLVDLGEADIEELYRWVVSTGRSRGTVAHLKRTINTALVRAVKRGQLAINPVPEVEMCGTTRDLPEPYDLDEIDLLIDTIRGLPYGIRWQLALLGMRRSEVLGLRWQNLNLNLGVLKVRNSLVWSDMRHGCLTRDSEPTCGKSQARHCPDVIPSEPSFGPLKTAKSKRDITLPDQLIEELRAHKAAQDVQRAAAGGGWQDYDCVIADALGVPSRLDFDRSEWVRVYSCAGLRPIRIHDLRHTAATALLTLGEDSRSLMPIFGWASLKEVERYAHVVPAVRRRVAEAQGRLFTGKRSSETSRPSSDRAAEDWRRSG